MPQQDGHAGNEGNKQESVKATEPTKATAPTAVPETDIRDTQQPRIRSPRGGLRRWIANQPSDNAENQQQHQQHPRSTTHAALSPPQSPRSGLQQWANAQDSTSQALRQSNSVNENRSRVVSKRLLASVVIAAPLVVLALSRAARGSGSGDESP